MVLFVTAFVEAVGLMMILPILPYYAENVGASATLVGLLISAFAVSQLALAPVWGRCSDRYGRRPVIVAGLLITAFAYGVFAVADSIAVLLLSRIVQGIGGGTIGVVQAYVADTSLPDRRTKNLGWLSAITSLGAIVGPAFGSAMVSVGGQRLPGIAASVLALVAAGFAWRSLRESREPAPVGHTARQAGTGRAAIRRVLVHWHEPAPRLIWIYMVAIGAFYGTIQIVPLFLMDRFGITEHSIGYFVMYLGGMGFVIRTLLLGRAVDKLGEARLSRLGIMLLAAGLVSTGLARHPVLLAIGFTLMPLGTAFIFPCVTGLLSQIVTSTERGLFMGIQHTFGGVSRVAFPIAAGVLMDHLSTGAPLWIAGLLVAATLPLTRNIATPTPDPTARPGSNRDTTHQQSPYLAAELPT